MRLQLIRPHNDFVSPQVFNRMFTMHGTTMIFFVAMPMVFGFANYLVPLMIGARDMAFPRLNAFSFWMSALGGLFLYFSFFGGDGLYGAGSAPDVGWFAYAPLTAKTFSVGHSTDFWTLSLLSSGIGSIGTAINIIATILCMRCPGMTLGKMPLLVWLNLVMAGLVILAVSPLSAAQIMLWSTAISGRISSTPRRADRRSSGCTSSGSSDTRRSTCWCFRPLRSRPKSFPVFSRKAIFGYPVMVLATMAIGFIGMSVWAHHMFTIGMSAGANTFFVLSTMAIAVPTGIKIFNWLATMWGGKDSICDAHAVLRRLSVPVSRCGIDRSDAGRSSARLAAREFVLRGGSLSLRNRRRHSFLYFRRVLLLVSESVRKDVQRSARKTALLAVCYRLPSDVRLHARSREFSECRAGSIPMSRAVAGTSGI